MRVLIANVYSYQNKGDAAIVISLLQEVRRVFPHADVLIQTADVQHDEGKYGAPITASLLWTLLSGVKHRMLPLRLWVLLQGFVGLYLAFAWFRLFGRVPLGIVPPRLRQFVLDNTAADLVVVCGGGYLRTQTPSLRDVLLLKVTCLNFLAAKYFGKPVFLFSQSIGPVHGDWQRRMLKHTLDRVDLIEAREDVSIKYLQTLQPKAPVVQTADPALLLGGKGRFPEEIVQLHKGRLHVGITVRKWFKTDEQLDAYILAVARTIDYLVEQHHADVFYVPQVIAEDFGDDDRVIARRVWEAVQARNLPFFTVVEADLHPFEVIGLCGKMDMFIGTRMHSNIFALINHVPVVAIEYEHKTKGIMRGLDLEPLTIDIQDVTFEALKEKVDMLLRDPSAWRSRITNHLPSQIAEARRAINVISEVYEGKTA